MNAVRICFPEIGGTKNRGSRAEWDLQLQNGELVRAHERDGVWKIDGVYD